VVCNVIASNIGANEFELIGNSVQVKRISTLFRQEGVDNDHFNAHLDQAAREIAADEAHATGDQHGTTVILGTKVVHF
jgi:hypothetical protein